MVTTTKASNKQGCDDDGDYDDDEREEHCKTMEETVHLGLNFVSWTLRTISWAALLVPVAGKKRMMPNDRIKNFNVDDIQHSESNEEIFGVLYFVFWTLTLIPLLKYVFIMLRADDNGKGRTFALYSLSKTFTLYSLLCRHAQVNTLPYCQLADEELSEYTIDGERSPGSRLKSTMEKHRVLQRVNKGRPGLFPPANGKFFEKWENDGLGFPSVLFLPFVE
ncbi:hypothetical protein Vadar_005399 [Vaccinium darrowii]|nr:hypothetical protein Vadar_005399 [Vaccinium darrowii]